MTRIHVLSDLHMEFAPFTPVAVAADVTVLAGNIYTRHRGVPWQDAAALFGRPVVMIAGNHAFYGGKIDTSIPKLKQAGAARGMTVLERDEAIIAGTRILGCTLWTDFRLFAGDDLERAKLDAMRCVGDRQGPHINDFWLIRVAADGYRGFRPKDAADLHAVSVAWLRARLAVPFPGPTVVVTHHAPSWHAVPPHKREDRLTAAYASSLDGLIEEFQPDLWIWGHLHQSVPPFRIGRTLMLSNPRGYVPFAPNPGFKPDLVVETG